MGLGYLPQEASVFRKLSVEDNIMAILEMTTLSKQEQKDKLEALLDEFRLHHVRRNNGDSLSGGERRRTEIARALAVDPKFILLDEPFAGVDPIAVDTIQTVVARLKYKNIGILITDHNVHETLSICDRAYLLIEGKIFKHGTAEELAADEKVRRLYLGRNFELRRKDYLHEEARKSNKLSREDSIMAVENALMQLSELHLRKKANEHSLNYTENKEKDEEDEENLNGYAKLLSDLKNDLVEYADANAKVEILQKANQLMADGRDLETDLTELLKALRENGG
jgi:ABC-type multidrug transport system ATPase subunit